MKADGREDILPSVESVTLFSQKRFREDAISALLVGLAMGVYGIMGEKGQRLDQFDAARDGQILLFWPLILTAIIFVVHGTKWFRYRSQYRFGIRAAEEPRG